MQVRFYLPGTVLTSVSHFGRRDRPRTWKHDEESVEGNVSNSSSSQLRLVNVIPFDYISNNARSPTGHLNDIQGNARPAGFLRDSRTAWGQRTDVA